MWSNVLSIIIFCGVNLEQIYFEIVNTKTWNNFLPSKTLDKLIVHL